MYQNPPLYAPGPPVVHATVRRRRSLIVMLLLPFLVFGLAFFGGSYAIAPEPDIEVLPGFAFVDTDVLLVPYERHGARGMFQTMTQDEFQVRLAAVDPATGETLWDTQLSDQLVWTASVLAGGRQYAYVATDSGLAIVAMADGAVVAEGTGVAGLGEAYLVARSAYAYDAVGRRVMAMNASGDVLAGDWTNDYLIALVVMVVLILPLVGLPRGRRTSGVPKEFDGAPIGIGTVTGATRTGRSVHDQPELDIHLRVDTADGRSFPATARHVVDLTDLVAVQPNAILPVRYLSDGRVALATDAPTYELPQDKKLLPTSIAQVQPGMAVRVRYLPHDESDVAIVTTALAP